MARAGAAAAFLTILSVLLLLQLLGGGAPAAMAAAAYKPAAAAQAQLGDGGVLPRPRPAGAAVKIPPVPESPMGRRGGA
ncbi:hypothetical protein BRADI_3g07284v3 [Brachypodium distachyon]|uniref:Uncharacterized protein n=1 Tax=Brachypodium distachyon TaxID=15368 RepID=A0A2K2CVQ7_BRADI|nr:hypothetical protein BRADI_3g07284v3 [Brachypodium distachyon]